MGSHHCMSSGGAPTGPAMSARHALLACRVLVALLVSVFCLAASERALAGPQEVTRHAKVELLRSFGRTFGGPSQLLILGSSRAMRADPAVWKKTLHVRAFNAAVSSGTALDAYAFTRLLASDYPDARCAVVWFLDIETMRLGADPPYVRSVPALRRFLPRAALRKPHGTSRVSRRDLAGGALPGHSTMRPHLRANGALVWWWHDWQRAHGRTTANGVRFQMRQYAQIYGGAGSYHISGSAKWYVAQIIKDANRRAVVPVIVLPPYHPALRRYVSGRGWKQAYAQVRRFLTGLEKRYDLRLLDLTSLSSFGGWPTGFYDGVHPRAALMRSILRTVAARERGYLQPPPDLPGLSWMASALALQTQNAGPSPELPVLRPGLSLPYSSR